MQLIKNSGQKIGLVAAALLLASTFPSFAYCTKPDSPSCSEQYGSFDDQEDYENCKQEMESYKSDMDEYLQCMKRESDDALQEYNDAVESFNRRVNN